MRSLLILISISTFAAAAEPLLPGFRRSSHFDEQIREEWHDGNVRIHFNAAEKFDPAKITRIVLFATPNGNTIEETLGCAKVEGSFRYDIQHVAAQIRRFRELTPDENTVLVVLEAGGLTWPSFRAKFKDNPERIRKLVEGIIKRLPVKEYRITLTGHSGGGSFTSGFLNGGDIPDSVERIAYLDSNYSYSDDEKHGDKLLTWLKGNDQRRLIVIAYDDRKIMLDGKLVVGPTGGTWRATDRMLERFKKDVEFETRTREPFEIHSALENRIQFIRHPNPDNKILHTVLVGEMNGLLRALATGRDLKWGNFGGPRAYTKWVQPAPGIPKRQTDALDGSKLIPILEGMSFADREARIARELLAGNVPYFLRQTASVKTTRNNHELEFFVMPDYLALGSSEDFVRMPMTPQTATLVATAWGYVLPTCQMVNDIHTAAKVKLSPIPMGEPRESVGQFFKHHNLIEDQRKGHRLGDLVSGVKKDVVWSNRILEKPKRLALYGWHKDDGKPIQPLTIVHHDGYVDYSHGIRLVKRIVLLDNKLRDIRDLARDPDLSKLISDEGVLTLPGYE